MEIPRDSPYLALALERKHPVAAEKIDRRTIDVLLDGLFGPDDSQPITPYQEFDIERICQRFNETVGDDLI